MDTNVFNTGVAGFLHSTIQTGGFLGGISAVGQDGGMQKVLTGLTPGALVTVNLHISATAGTIIIAANNWNGAAGAALGAALPVNGPGPYTYMFTPTSSSALLSLGGIVSYLNPQTDIVTVSSVSYTQPNGVVSSPQLVQLSSVGKDRYEFGFNGKLKDNEWAGLGNWYNFGAREYDTRLVHFPTRDPKAAKYPGQSPYVFAADNPISLLDENGEGARPAQDPKFEGRLLQAGLQSFVDVLQRCNNYSLGAFEATLNKKVFTEQVSNKILGLAGEAVISDYLENRMYNTVETENLNDPKGHFAPGRIPQSMINASITVGGWDADKSIDVLYSFKALPGTATRMAFSKRNGYLKDDGELFKRPTNFVMEVKTGYSISNFIKGFNQALSKSKAVPNSVPVLVMDGKEYRDDYQNNAAFRSAADNFVNAGGRLMIPDDLNEKALGMVKKAVDAGKGKTP